MSNEEIFRLAVLRSGIKLEILGMKRSGGRRSCYAIVKSELGFKGNRKRVLEQLEAYIKEKKNEYNNNRKTNEPRQHTRDTKEERTTQDSERQGVPRPT